MSSDPVSGGGGVRSDLVSVSCPAVFALYAGPAFGFPSVRPMCTHTIDNGTLESTMAQRRK